MPIKRVCLVPTNKNEYDEEWNIAVDLFLGEGNIPTDRMTSFGSMGGLTEQAMCIEPFLLYRDGKLDFGTNFEDADQNHKLNIRGSGRAVNVGELFTYTNSEEEITYRVTQIVDPR